MLFDYNWRKILFVYVSLVSDGNASEEDKADDLTNEDQICLCCAEFKKKSLLAASYVIWST